jgi:hypothetical protein
MRDMHVELQGDTSGGTDYGTFALAQIWQICRICTKKYA